MTETTERRVSHDELTRMVLACTGCHAELTFDLENDKQRRSLIEQHYHLKCPFCEQPFDTNLCSSVQAFVAWRTRVAESKQPVVFRIPVARGQ